jgi:hypothetical protein
VTRCIVTVATDRYVPLQARLLKSLADAGYRDGVCGWTGSLPEGCPPHAADPYAFKVHSLRAAAARGFRTVLWLDSPCVATGPVDPLFDRIERDGHLLVDGGDVVGRWSSDACLAAYGLSRDEAMSLPLMNGSMIGLDLASARSRAWFDGLADGLDRGLFRGADFTDAAPTELRRAKPAKSVGRVSEDPRCWGHRHDEAVGSILARRHGLAFSAPEAVTALEYRAER